MAEHLQYPVRASVIEMRNGDGMAITYFRKTMELHYGFVDKPPRHVAYDVTPADIAAVAKAGGSFQDFKRYRDLSTQANGASDISKSSLRSSKR